MREVVILHVSDAQFGEHHRFGTGVTSLATRMIDVLGDLPTGVPPIDLVVFSGDAAELGKPSEFEVAANFLKELLAALDLGPERLVVVPGNHDVNWNACRAYIYAELAAERTPLPPYEPKWDAYCTFLEATYPSGPTSPLDGVRTFPDLGLAVAALNSTIEETHEQHWGNCGEEQLRRHAALLQATDADVKIAVVHHNVRKHAQVDSENLRDEGDFTRIIGREVDLVLHGHTHNGKRDHLSDGTLVLSTGSAALKLEQRPEEIPNQFQIVALRRGAARRWAFRYIPGIKQWRLDSEVGGSSSPGYEEIEIERGSHRQRPLVTTEPGARAPTQRARSADPLSGRATQQHVSDRAMRAFRESLREGVDLAQAGLSTMDTLDRLGLLDQGLLTRAAALLFADDPQRDLPGAVVHCVEYHGIDKTAERESEIILGTARDQVDRALDFLLSRIPRRERAGNHGQSSVAYSYPTVCLREVLVNAVVHRDYGDDRRTVHVRLFDNRIEITSPGTWASGRAIDGSVPLSDLESESVRRNPLVANAMSLIRYFEGEGSGVPTAVRDSESSRAPEPQARVADGFVIVTVFPSDLDPDVLDALFTDAERLPGLKLFQEPKGYGTSVWDEATYVRQTIGPVSASGEPTQVSAPVETVLTSEQQRVVVFGQAGAGKTTLVRQLAAGLGRERRILPLVVQARQLIRRKSPNVDLIGALVREFHGRGIEITRTAIEATLDNTNAALFIDGLDEVEDARERAVIVAAVNDFAARRRLLKAIMTSRPTHDKALGLKEWQAVELQPWSAEDFVRYLRSVETPEDPDRWSEQLSRAVFADTNLAELATNPFMAKLMVDVFEQRDAILTGRASLYGAAVDWLTERADHSRGLAAPTARRQTRRWLRSLAIAAVEGGRTFSDLPFRWCTDVLDRVQDDAEPPAAFLRRTTDRGGILVETRVASSGEPVLGFAQRGFGEYLAAEALLERRDRNTLLDFLWSASQGRREPHRAVAELALAMVGSKTRAPLVSAMLANAQALSPAARLDVLEVVGAALNDIGRPALEDTEFLAAVEETLQHTTSAVDQARAAELVLGASRRRTSIQS